MPGKWTTPLYTFAAARRKIVVNVTRSVPNFRVPTPGFADIVAHLQGNGMTRILDFGAGKLRNSEYMLSLKAGFRVWAVEYQEVFVKPDGAARLAEIQRKYKGFFLKRWPDEFLDWDVEVDAVLLINVANVIPDEGDRQLIVRECTKRLRRGGWFLWMSQHGEPGYKPGVTLRLGAPDGGWFYRLDQEFQTYYKEFTIPDIKAYFSPRVYHEGDVVSSPHHRAFLFEKK
jgi:hypothetical protein